MTAVIHQLTVEVWVLVSRYLATARDACAVAATCSALRAVFSSPPIVHETRARLGVQHALRTHAYAALVYSLAEGVVIGGCLTPLPPADAAVVFSAALYHPSASGSAALCAIMSEPCAALMAAHASDEVRACVDARYAALELDDGDSGVAVPLDDAKIAREVAWGLAHNRLLTDEHAVEAIAWHAASGLDEPAFLSSALCAATLGRDAKRALLIAALPGVDLSYAHSLVLRLCAEHSHTAPILAGLLGHATAGRALAMPTLSMPELTIGDIICATAAEHGCADVLALLLGDERVDPAGGDNWAVCKAAECGEAGVLALLLADPRVDPTVDASLPLALARQAGHAECVRLLLHASVS